MKTFPEPAEGTHPLKYYGLWTMDKKHNLKEKARGQKKTSKSPKPEARS